MLRNLVRKTASVVRPRRETKSATSRSWEGGTGGSRFEPLEPRLVLAAGPLVISELMAVNQGVYTDGDGNSPDWIEIHNPTGSTVNLEGWYLSDDPDDLTRWSFPNVSLGPNAYRIVFASGQLIDDYVDAQGNLHTNFQLDGAGEYLALVQPDGMTVSDEYTPGFPEQFSNISYGRSQNSSAYELAASGWRYRVPDSFDATLGSDWTAVGYDDSAWASAERTPQVLVTEIGTTNPDFVEIQNLSGQVMDTSGWVVAVNNAQGTPPSIDSMHATLWELPDSMSVGEVLYQSDQTWGENIYWSTNGSGWAMIVDDHGSVVDFVVWGYSEEEIGALVLEDVNGFVVTAAGAWSGPATAAVGSTDFSIQRGGSADHNDATDWASVSPPSAQVQNPGLTSPFSATQAPGMGFELNPPGLGGEVGFDLAGAMHGTNASLWTRVAFDIEDPAAFDTMQLRMQYNDGFVAYLNGREVARRNAPTSLSWNSAATASRSVDDSLQAEEIDLSEFLNELVVGTNVLAVHGLNVSANDGNFLILPELAAIRSGAQYFHPPTPGEANGDGYLGVVRDTQFSVDRGFFEDTFAVEITTDTPATTIRYTADGSTPTATHGSDYSGPLTISSTTTLRAVALKPGYIPTNVDTQTYLFLDDVLTQDGAGFPTNWAHTGTGDYAMDPGVVYGPSEVDRSGQTFGVKDALQAIPTLSLVMDQDDWFGGGGQGIYILGENSPRAVSAELLYPDGSNGFQVDGSVEIVGGTSPNRWKMDKLSMRLKFQRDVGDPGSPYYVENWGDPKLEFPVFGAEATDRFDTLVVDARMNMSWPYGGGVDPDFQRTHAQYTRDQFAADLQNAMGGYAPHGISTHLYVNGLYWGLYRLHERPDEHFAAAYLGGQDEDYDVIKHNENEVVQGTNQNYLEMHSIAAAGLSSNAQYQVIQQYLDVPAFIDYMLTNFFIGNTDWAHQNWYATRNRVDPDGRWRFHSWDAEHSMEGLYDNVTAKNDGYGSPTFLHQQLSANAEYRLLFADHIQRHFFNDGVLTTEAAQALYQIRLNEVDRAVMAESARWGDNREDVSGTTYRRSSHWIPERSRILYTYLQQRPGLVFSQLRTRGLYPNVVAPAYNQHGGLVPDGFGVSITGASGTVYYTLDGSDPRLPGGATTPGALVYDDSPIVLSHSVRIKARAHSGGEWSALSEADFFVGSMAAAGNLAITELNYNPAPPTAEEMTAGWLDNDVFEFVELCNVGPQAIDLGGVQLGGGVDFTLGSAAFELAPGERVVVVANQDAFTARYGAGVPVAGRYDRQLDNNGEQITLVDRFGQPILSFTYDDGNGWPGRADGKGATLELIDPLAIPATEPERTAFLEDADNWRSSSEYGGTPGAAGAGPLGDVVVNEVLTHTDWPSCDAIELHNTTDMPIEVGGWYLSDSWGWGENAGRDNYRKFRIPDGTTIPGHGYLVFDEDDFNPMPLDPGPDDFALDGAYGDDVWLMEADAQGELTRFVDHVEFGAAANGETFGRWPNGTGELYPMLTATLDPVAGQNSGPRVGPMVVSEVMYNPGSFEGADELEFIEIYNPTAATVDLTNWRIRGGVDFNFAPGTLLAAHATLVVVPFDPSDSQKLSAFHDDYGIGGEVQIVGGYSGRLDNGGERIELQSPDFPPADDPTFIPRLLEDQVRYYDQMPWPLEADGTGQSLNRLADSAWGNDGASWLAAGPTPGEVPLLGSAEVAGRYVFYNYSSFDGNSPAANAQDDNAIATDKQALLPGQTATFANYTSFSRGINGIMIDFRGLPDGASLAADDFVFRVGNDNAPGAWGAAPSPALITVRPTQGAGGSDRVTIVFGDYGITKQWLQVTVLATADTGLSAPDVFYFGNAVGEAGNSTADAKVNASDMLLARNNPRNFLNPAPVDFPFDFNRDARVNATDMLLARNNQTHFLNALKLIAVPESLLKSALAEEKLVGGKTLSREAVLATAGAEEWGATVALPGKMAWLYEFERSHANPATTDKDKVVDDPEGLFGPGGEG
ncbi:MAG: lamin tail domain-containing protein [Pirellulales bacterium]|nr:lamin tail domain-containing protein [Pirellulales bacterium]